LAIKEENPSVITDGFKIISYINIIFGSPEVNMKMMMM